MERIIEICIEINQHQSNDVKVALGGKVQRPETLCLHRLRPELLPLFEDQLVDHILDAVSVD